MSWSYSQGTPQFDLDLQSDGDWCPSCWHVRVALFHEEKPTTYAHTRAQLYDGALIGMSSGALKRSVGWI